VSITGGLEIVAIQKALQNFVVACTGLPADHVVWAQQYAPRQTQSSIVMKFSFVGDDGMPWIDTETNYYTFSDVVVTSVDDATGTLTKVTHGLLTGDGPIRLVGTDLPDGLEEDVNYWVIKTGADTFKLATTFLNAMNLSAITLADAGSGVITLVDTATTLRVGQEFTYLSRSLVKAVLSLECYTSRGVGVDMAAAVLWRINSKRRLPTPAQILEDANVGIIDFGRVRVIDGVQDLVLLEPRAMVDIMLHLVSEDSETGGIIERTEITNEDTTDTFTVDGLE
jgi:hypothetical protein